MTTVFCIDFDETVAHTDRLRDDLADAIHHLGGDSLVNAYLTAYEAVRAEHGVPRMPRILKAATEQSGVDNNVHRQLAAIFQDFSYQEYLYPGAEELIRHLKQQGRVLLFSDGDAFFQTHKIHSTSLATLVDSVVILPHKVEYFDELSGFWPADRYVFIDDKHTVLTAAKKYFGDTTMTVLVRQGRYSDSQHSETNGATVESITDVAALFPL